MTLGWQTPISNYIKGILPNNKDEHYWGECYDCNVHIQFEPHYDFGEARIGLGNNAIVFGKCFKNWLVPYAIKKNIDKEQIINIINKAPHSVLDIPSEVWNLSKKDLKNYINK